MTWPLLLLAAFAIAVAWPAFSLTHRADASQPVGTAGRVDRLSLVLLAIPSLATAS